MRWHCFSNASAGSCWQLSWLSTCICFPGAHTPPASTDSSQLCGIFALYVQLSVISATSKRRSILFFFFSPLAQVTAALGISTHLRAQGKFPTMPFAAGVLTGKIEMQKSKQKLLSQQLSPPPPEVNVNSLVGGGRGSPPARGIPQRPPPPKVCGGTSICVLCW